MISAATRSLFVVCAGALASDIASYVRHRQTVGEPTHISGFVDDHRFEPRFEGAPLLGGIADFGAFLKAHADETVWYIAAVGANRTRAEVVRRLERLEAPNLKPMSIIHRAAVFAEDTPIGAGSLIGPGAVVTSHVTLGDHGVLSANCSVSHGASLAAFVHVAPGASVCSGVMVQEGGYIGAGATVANNIVVGAWSVIEAGAVVTENVPAHVTVSGSPARIVQRHARHTRFPMIAG